MTLVLTLSDTCQETTITNYAEIASAQDANGNPAVDYDSTYDSDLTNVGNVEDNETDEQHLQNPDDDEDDHDLAQIYLQHSFDLAITKSIVSPGPYHGGDDVEFEITMINQ